MKRSSLIGRHVLGVSVTLFGLVLALTVNWERLSYELAQYQEDTTETEVPPPPEDPLEGVDFRHYYFLDGLWQKIEPEDLESEEAVEPGTEPSEEVREGLPPVDSPVLDSSRPPVPPAP